MFLNHGQKEDKLKVGLKLIDIMISAVGMVKLSTVRSGKQTKTYVEFTQGNYGLDKTTTQK